MRVKSEEEIRAIQYHIARITPVYCNISSLLINALSYFERGMLRYNEKAVKATISIVEDNYVPITFVTKSRKKYTIKAFPVLYDYPCTKDDYSRRFTKLSRELTLYCGNFIKFDAKKLKIRIG